jgi:hypothetical protein
MAYSTNLNINSPKEQIPKVELGNLTISELKLILAKLYQEKTKILENTEDKDIKKRLALEIDRTVELAIILNKNNKFTKDEIDNLKTLIINPNENKKEYFDYKTTITYK